VIEEPPSRGPAALPAERSAAESDTASDQHELAFRSIGAPRGRSVREWSPVLLLALAGLAATFALAYATVYCAGAGLAEAAGTREVLGFIPIPELPAPLCALAWGWATGGTALVTILTLIALRALRRMASGRAISLVADPHALRIGRSPKRARVRLWTTISALRAEYAFAGHSGPLRIEVRTGRTWLDLGWHGQDTGLVDLIARRAGLNRRTKTKHGLRCSRGAATKLAPSG